MPEPACPPTNTASEAMGPRDSTQVFPAVGPRAASSPSVHPGPPHCVPAGRPPAESFLHALILALKGGRGLGVTVNKELPALTSVVTYFTGEETEAGGMPCPLSSLRERPRPVGAGLLCGGRLSAGSFPCPASLWLNLCGIDSFNGHILPWEYQRAFQTIDSPSRECGSRIRTGNHLVLPISAPPTLLPVQGHTGSQPFRPCNNSDPSTTGQGGP